MIRPGSAEGASTLAALAAIPWCCVAPGVLSLASMSGAIAARAWLARFAWVLLPLCVALLARALWLVHVRRQGRPWACWMTWAAALLVLALWAPRWMAWISR